MENLSFAAQNILETKPRYWEHKLFAQVLQDELVQRADLRKQHRDNASIYPKEQILPKNFVPLVRKRLTENSELVQEAATVQQFLADAAFGSSGIGRDEFFMAHLARELGRLYEELLQWSLEWRRLLLPQHRIYRSFPYEASIYGEAFFQSVESLPERLGIQLKAQEDAPLEQEKRFRLGLDMEPFNSRNFQKEADKLIRRLLG